MLFSPLPPKEPTAFYNDNYVVAKFVPYTVKETKEVAPVRVIPKDKLCSCVEYAKAVLGRDGERWGNAWDIKPNSKTPSPNALILFKDHVGVVVESDASFVRYRDANYRKCQEGWWELEVDNPKILGYRVLN